MKEFFEKLKKWGKVFILSARNMLCFMFYVIATAIIFFLISEIAGLILYKLIFAIIGANRYYEIYKSDTFFFIYINFLSGIPLILLVLVKDAKLLIIMEDNKEVSIIKEIRKKIKKKKFKRIK